MRLRGARVVVACAAAAVLGGACERDAWIGQDRRAIGAAGQAPDAAAGGAGAGGARTDAALSPHVCHPATCQGRIYACGDCVDNDGDGKVDMDDPDCFGPCHNAEDTFFGSIPGQNHDPCVEDCYFDQDSGSGNDDCSWSRVCDPLEVAPDYPPEGPSCAYNPTAKVPRVGDCAAAETQSAKCLSVCGPLVPNGCDCFGCCSIPGAPTPVWLGSVDDLGNPTCDLAHVADPTRCKPCTQVQGCLNPCDTCELCIGKQVLPPSCGGSPPPTCPAPKCAVGTPCGSDCLPSCPDGQACVTGCCVDATLQ